MRILNKVLSAAAIGLLAFPGCLNEDGDAPESGPVVQGAQVPGYDDSVVRHCGTEELTADEMLQVEQDTYARLVALGVDVAGLDLQESRIRTDGITPDLHTESAPFVTTYNVPVYFHIIKNSAGNGAVTATQISNQIATMNSAYSSTGTTFTLAATTTTVNSTWYTDCAAGSESAMKTAIRGTSGNWKDLHVYTCAPSGGLLGRSTWPWGTNKTMDGILLHYGTVNGGNQTNYNLGDTLVHAAGHWLGLYHTFQGGCSGGDSVSDTAAESTSAGGCPTGRDTCTGTSYPGVDPITNYMDYTYDSCMYLFTAGQNTRMDTQYTSGRYPY